MLCQQKRIMELARAVKSTLGHRWGQRSTEARYVSQRFLITCQCALKINGTDLIDGAANGAKLARVQSKGLIG